MYSMGKRPRRRDAPREPVKAPGARLVELDQKVRSAPISFSMLAIGL